MNGRVDDTGRALVRIHLRHPTTAQDVQVDAWIDTGFTGDLVLPIQQVIFLGLPLGHGVGAQLADGSQVNLDTYSCLLDWFVEWKQIEVVANQGQLPLLGVGLLSERHLNIDYRAKTVLVE